MQYPAESDLWRLNYTIKPKPILVSDDQSRVIGRFRQVFPLTLFPDELVIEELRIVWVKNKGPWTNEIISIMATDIASVNASRGLLLGHVHIKSLTGGPQILVDNLARSNVFKIRSFIEGIALASREGLKIEHKDLETERASLLAAGEVKTNLI